MVAEFRAQRRRIDARRRDDFNPSFQQLDKLWGWSLIVNKGGIHMRRCADGPSRSQMRLSKVDSDRFELHSILR